MRETEVEVLLSKTPEKSAEMDSYGKVGPEMKCGEENWKKTVSKSRCQSEGAADVGGRWCLTNSMHHVVGFGTWCGYKVLW